MNSLCLLKIGTALGILCYIGIHVVYLEQFFEYICYVINMIISIIITGKIFKRSLRQTSYQRVE